MKGNKEFLSTGEVANLWTSYMNNSMGICMNQYALQVIEDSNIRDIYEFALKLSQKNIKQLTRIFNRIHFPIPYAFTNKDINLKAPRLFSDQFHLFYLHELSVHGLSGYSLALTTSVSPDVRQFNVDAMNSTSELYSKTLKLLQSKGLYDDFPKIPTPERPEIAEKQAYLAGWFGEHRPLNVIEITSIFSNLKKSIMAKALAIGFSQTAQSKEIRAFMMRVVKLAEKHIELFSSVLHDDFINSAVYWDTHVTSSRVAPFSDKLMMVHGGFIISAAMTYYGTGLATNMRRDLAVHYATSIARDSKLSEDGMNIMIKNGWHEQPPQAANREQLFRNIDGTQ
ncbi:DUF3231 family protein [Alkalihalobacillus sp. AL-G]|uniref:DUF3231 family protein n=1 Tax=Alkalihalobacillus sp. AL-G TaxID=2926399 RepID=UPI00272CE304|nr:DUF3231 family protein [Alkalihalobacillus sp. AL-G]WLD93751.1 DUF3231 family protein [Alkalihalobacillus sp. AL-G]